MARNVRLQEDAEAALREAAARSGRSQQQLIREAIDEKLGLSRDRLVVTSPAAASMRRAERLAQLAVTAPASPFRELGDLIQLGPGETSTGLLDREDRF